MPTQLILLSGFETFFSVFLFKFLLIMCFCALAYSILFLARSLKGNATRKLKMLSIILSVVTTIPFFIALYVLVSKDNPLAPLRLWALFFIPLILTGIALLIKPKNN